LDLQWEICALAGAWNGCVEIAEASIKIDPDRVEAWIHRSFALHELKCTREALENLLPAAEKFPGVWMIPYNLACYCTQLGRLDEASEWIPKAMAIDADAVKRAGIDDPDLKPLWDSWGGFAMNR
jgi:tetratricopeptide (TPR) repeat protein